MIRTFGMKEVPFTCVFCDMKFGCMDSLRIHIRNRKCNAIEDARPMWVIRDEISNLASKLRNNKKEFEHSVKKTYIDELKMDPSIIQPIIDEYIQFIDE